MPDASSRSRLKLAPSWKTTVLKSNWSGESLTPLVIRAEICGRGKPGRLIEVLGVDVVGVGRRRRGSGGVGLREDLARRVFLEPALYARLDDPEDDRAEAAVGTDGADVAGLKRPGVPPAIVAEPSVPLTSITPAMSWPTWAWRRAIVMVSRLPATLTWAVVVIEPSEPIVREPRSPG